MKARKMKSYLALGVMLAVASSNGWAVMVTGGPTGAPSADGTVPRPLSEPVEHPRRAGKIESIDIANGTIVIGGKSYLVSLSTVMVHSTDPAADRNPLKLRAGSIVNFTTVRELSGKERVNEIWVISPGGGNGR